MASWILKADRRKIDYDRLVEELRSLERSVQDLEFSLFESRHFEEAPDDRGFRDFAPMGRLTHPDLDALEIVAEELLLEFGWLIDFARSDSVT